MCVVIPAPPCFCSRHTLYIRSGRTVMSHWFVDCCFDHWSWTCWPSPSWFLAVLSCTSDKTRSAKRLEEGLFRRHKAENTLGKVQVVRQDVPEWQKLCKPRHRANPASASMLLLSFLIDFQKNVKALLRLDISY